MGTTRDLSRLSRLIRLILLLSYILLSLAIAAVTVVILAVPEGADPHFALVSADLHPLCTFTISL